MGKKTIHLYVVGRLFLNGFGIGSWLFLGSGDEKKRSSPKVYKEESLAGPLKYLTMVPEFIVNFGPGSKVRYLQVDLQISTRNEDSLAIVNTYRPVIRNDILVILSDVKYEDLKDRAGKEALQQRLLNTINKVVVAAEHTATQGEQKDANGDEHSNQDEPVKGPIENVFYASFIMK